MKTSASVVSIIFVVAALSSANIENAAAQESNTAVEVDAGNVAFAYSDGYWDHNLRWHKWSGDTQRNARTQPYERYNPWRNAPERNRYNRDTMPNRVSDLSRNPYRD